MANLRLLLVVSVLCAVFTDVLAQSRGSVRYRANDEEIDGESARAERPIPARRSSARRQRPTPAPEPSEVNDELPAYQLPTRGGTTGRRVPTRVSADQFSAPPPAVPLAPEEPLLPVVVDELPPVTTAAPGEKSQGRRRRPKKRRRPQNGATKPVINEEKQNINDPENIKVPAAELISREHRPLQALNNNAEFINNPNTYDAPTGLADKPLWSNDKLENTAGDSSRRNSKPTQYYPPQTGENRLPIEDTERIEHSRGYSEPSLPVLSPEAPSRRYVPPKPAVEEPSRASYVPVLSPIRVPSEGLSRIPNEYSGSRNQESTRQTRPSDRRNPQRGPGSRTSYIPIPNSEEESSRSTVPKAAQNLIPRSNQPNNADVGQPEVRLPPTEQPLIVNEYDKIDLNNSPGYGGEEKSLSRLHEDENPGVDSIEHAGPNTANRHLDSSKVLYDSPYSLYNENIGTEELPDSVMPPPRNSETAPHAPRDTYNDAEPQESPERTQTNNNVNSDRSQLSRYQPPLQRSGSRYNNEDSERLVSTRNFAREDQSTEAPTRGRGSSRYQPESAPAEFIRTRSSSRSYSDVPTRTRSSQTQESSQAPSRSRNTQRYQPDSAESSSRVSARRQPVDSEYVRDTPIRERAPETPSYRQRAPVPTSEEESSQYISHPPRKAPERIPEDERQAENEPDRNAAPSRPPRYEVPENTEPYSYEEPADEPQDPSAYEPEYQAPRQSSRREPTSAYEPEYQAPRQSSRREPTSAYEPEYQAPKQPSRREPLPQRAPSPREQPEYQAPRQPPSRREPSPQRVPSSREQPEYQAPRQPPSRRENTDRRGAPRQQQSDYRAPPQEDTRYQPQYQAPPQSDRNQARQQAPRQPSSRPRHPEPTSSQGRPSGSSKFSCPQAYGYFSDRVQCDKYYECRNGTAFESLCDDGLAFNEAGAPKFLRCDSLRDVDCSSRSELQEARPTENCPRRYGLYAHETDCTKFWNCVDGAATVVQCPPGLIFNDERATCDWADLVKSSCKTEDLLGFTCPEPESYDLKEGVYTTYPHPDNCQKHFVCINGEDGTRKPRMLSCNEGLVYNPATKSCTRPDDVPGCEDYYGSRSPPPKQRKPAREPVEDVEYDEEPTPKPRRRVVQHRRVRN